MTHFKHDRRHDLSRSALLFLSRREGLKDSPRAWARLRELASRFIAGETLEAAVEAVKALNAQGLMASFDHLNEAVRNEAETQEEVREYRRLLARIDALGVRANVSLKLTHAGCCSTGAGAGERPRRWSRRPRRAARSCGWTWRRAR